MDSDLRKLERLAKGGLASDIAAYWKACIKAGVTPPPNFKWAENRVVWTLYPNTYSHWDRWKKTIQEQQRVVKDNNGLDLMWFDELDGYTKWRNYATINDALLDLLEMADTGKLPKD